MTESRRRKTPLVADKRYPSKGRKPTATKRAAKPAGKKATARKTTTRKTARKKTRRKSGGNGGGGFFRRLFRWIWRLIWGVTWRVGAVAGLLLALAVGVVYTSLPDVDALLDGRARGSVTLLDRDGKVFAWRGDQFGGVITADTVSPHLKNAVVATEDKRFYRHFGVSPRGVASAVRINLSEGRGPLSGHGGSTITQQTAKLLCLGVPYVPSEWESEAAYEADCRQGSLWRKAKEAVYAMAMEVKYSKDEILTIYLNRAFLGAGARGFEAASQRYFGISAAEVNPAQAAMLAGLLVAPTRYAPTNNLQRSQDRAKLVIGLMEAQDYLTTAQASSARGSPAQLSEAAAARAGGYFADWVITELPSYFGTDTTDDVVIRTTLDQRLQKSAEEALKYIFQEKVREGSKAQAAIVVMSADGAVRAMVGGRKTRVSGAFNRATQALRQTGSSFKPFVYATALELGYSPLDTVVDEPYCVNIPGSGQWCPKNYTNKFYGRVTLADALKNSLNIPAVKVAEVAGLENVRTVASEFGIESNLAEGPALALGASESTLIEMTGAYAGILNGGSAVEPYGLSELKLLGDDTPMMVTSSGIGERVINDKAAKQLTWMMERVVSEGTGGRAKLPGWQVAGKTGTTQAARDAWFIGFTADYVAGVWMGYDDNTPLSGVTGGGLPAEIWKETMLRVTEGMTPTPLPMLAPDPPVRTAQPQQQRRRQGRGFEDAINNFFKNVFGN
ncbi:transglycosylase domain-containing protein [Ruegeria arenilitoris]|uniref:transglycosylase domain-containing protein n=1 Tax=Ruegeria arenilitoris TaxID=1173585 RepID=UPI00147BBC9E|nr:PBP1A family penicillin-binding protein [Ruegeria arenilitoris]